jgi:translation initiation factor 1A
MPPNSKGGKAYKKHKKGGEAESSDQTYIVQQAGQMIGRVIRLLGNRNVLCYCNDNRLRICHICGKMKGRVWIEPGDMVLLSLREFETQTVEGKDDRRGDIIGKYAPDHLKRLRKEPNANPKLFMKLETSENLTLAEIGIDKSHEQLLKATDDIGFVFEDGSDSEGEEKKAAKAAKAAGPPMPQAWGVTATTAATAATTDEVDIDNI